jgi:exodeoxyribonuclease V alpha subunit
LKILALLVEEGLRRGRPPKILLLAPTGKAADRLLEAVQSSLAQSQVAHEIGQHLPRAASTVHRALDAGYGRGARFRRGPDSPILADCVIVDEASMLDLSLTVHLLGALRSGARLVLLGDPDQLASVDAGSVLADLLTGLSEVADHPGTSSVPMAAVRLTKSYRFSSASGISGLARAVQEGDCTKAMALLASRSDPEISWFEPSSSDSAARRAIDGLADRYQPLLSAGSPEQCLAELGQFRVLCAVRHGARGVMELNRLISSRLGRSRVSGSYFHGEPLIILRNDLRLGLWNGDVGVVWRAQTGVLFAHFSRAERGIVRVPLAALPEHEPAFAMTVHKSQGSEYDEAVFVLPEASLSQNLTREVIYTALTRARRSVAVWGDESIFRSGIERVTSRSSGLADRLGQLARRSSSTPRRATRSRTRSISLCRSRTSMLLPSIAPFLA